MPQVKVATVDQIPQGKMKGVVVKGLQEQILVANVNGKLYAMAARCTHVGGPLEEGPLDGFTVTCPWHGSQFDIRTGKVLAAPAVEAKKTFKVTIKGRDILVDI